MISSSVSGATSFENVFNRIEIDEVKFQKTSYNSPKYRSLDWRVRVDDESVVTNSLRIEPLSLQEKAREKDLTEYRNTLGEVYSLEVSAQQCLDKSLTFLDLFHLKSSIKLQHGLKLVYDDLTKVLGKGVKRDLVKFNELLKMREKLVETKMNFNKLVLVSRSILAQLSVSSGSKPKRVGELNFDSFIDVADIKKNVKNFTFRNISIEKLGAIADIKKLDYESEIGRENRIFRHIQINHKKDFDTKNEDDQSIAMEFSFNLPWGGVKNSQSKMIEWKRAQAEFNKAKREGQSAINLNKDQLDIKIRNYIDLENDGYLKDLDKYLKALKRSSSNAPYKIVQVKEKILKQKLKLLDLRYEITKDYIYSLAEQGQLSKCNVSLLTRK